ncbi:hypothetical protein WA026_003883 [Henosepilachna vigintioctopunctata]|uniref:Uncharacterized protein n=1 Tax=Henosepilachna vigintioctopunctata TaxID=420089 RepID=A0AAW1UEJ8_9CUCU
MKTNNNKGHIVACGRYRGLGIQDLMSKYINKTLKKYQEKRQPQNSRYADPGKDRKKKNDIEFVPDDSMSITLKISEN